MNDNNKQTQSQKSPLGDLGVLKPAGMDIKVLGPGSPKCKALEKSTKEAIAEAGIEATVTKVEDIVEIMNYGVMSTPALVIDGKVVVKGKVPTVTEIKSLITK